MPAPDSSLGCQESIGKRPKQADAYAGSLLSRLPYVKKARMEENLFLITTRMHGDPGLSCHSPCIYESSEDENAWGMAFKGHSPCIKPALSVDQFFTSLPLQHQEYKQWLFASGSRLKLFIQLQIISASSMKWERLRFMTKKIRIRTMTFEFLPRIV